MQHLKYITAVTLLLLLSACSTAPQKSAGEHSDPFERVNRAVFEFNLKVDKHVLKPVAEAYDEYTPQPLKFGIHNFLQNLDDINVALNDLLQFKLKHAASDSGRFLVNSTIGLFGLFDVATDYGLPKRNEDLGQTLATWGIGDGPYLVLPFLGPSTLRDTAGLVGTGAFETWLYNDLTTRGVLIGVRTANIIDTRASFLGSEVILEKASLDEYIFARNAYLKRRAVLAQDLSPDEATENEISDEDLFDDL